MKRHEVGIGTLLVTALSSLPAFARGHDGEGMPDGGGGHVLSSAPPLNRLWGVTKTFDFSLLKLCSTSHARSKGDEDES